MQPTPLDGLHDIIAPDQVSWWPLAPAWWVIIALGCTLIVVMAVLFYQRYKFSKAKKTAIQASIEHRQDALQLHILLKRLVVHYYDAQIATQGTAQWCITLKRLTGQTFNEQELLQLYANTEHQPVLLNKLQHAIKQFKLKEKLDV